MHQFDFYSFSSQIFWVLSGLMFYFFFTCYLYLSEISCALKLREKIVNTVSGSSAIKVKFSNFFLISAKKTSLLKS